MATLKFLGATDTVTGSRFLLKSGADQVLIDCGLFQGPKELRLRNWSPMPRNGRHFEHVVLTHAHLDHTGFFPRLVKEGFHGEVYGTPATVDLCGLLWPDTGHLQEEDARFANKQEYSKHKPALPLYTEVEATEALSFLRVVPYNTEHRLSSQMFFSLLPAGHILGSSFVNVTVEENATLVTLLFSGDPSRHADGLRTLIRGAGNRPLTPVSGPE